MSSQKEVANVGGSLPANVQDMAAALANSAGQAGAAGGAENYMKFTKFGEWVFGAENTETEEGSKWAVNPNGFQHGYICWGIEGTPAEGTNLGEMLVPATQPMPLESDLPVYENGNWSKCIAVSMVCLDGEDEGIQVQWKANSHGGRKAYTQLLQAVIQQLQASAAEPVAVVSLEASSYDHKKYGKIFTPVLKVTGWMGMDGTPAEEPAAAIEEAPAEAPEEAAPAASEEAPRRRRRRKAS